MSERGQKKKFILSGVGVFTLLVPALFSLRSFAGFEIGNAWVTNEAGGYKFKIFEKWDVDKLDRFVDAIAPKSFGEKNKPRLRVDVLPVSQVTDGAEASWRPVQINGKTGTIRERYFEITGAYQAEIRLERSPNEVIIIMLDAQYDPGPKSGYSMLKEILGTFELSR